MEMTTEIKKSFCHLCLAECGILATVENNKIIKISPDFNDARSRGYICEKSQKLIEYQYSKDRITSPLKKVNGQLVPVTWEQAINEISDKLKHIIDSNRGDKIFYMSPIIMSDDSSITAETMKKFGTKYATNVLSVEIAHKQMIEYQLFGSFLRSDRENAETFIIIGQNPWVSQHYSRARSILNTFKKSSDRKLIVIDPCVTQTTKMADTHLKILPNTDAWALSALIKIIIDLNLIDQNFIETQTTNYDKIALHFSKLDLDMYLDRCGISYTQMRELAIVIGNSNSVSIDWGTGIWYTMHPHATNYLITLLYMITGNYRKSGAMIPFSMLINNHSFTESTTPFTNQPQPSGVTPASLVADNLYIDEINHFDCVVIDRNNPAARFPNSKYFIEQLSKINLVIVMDSFVTATTKLADYVLPIPTLFETYTPLGDLGRHLQLSKPIISAENLKSPANIMQLLLEQLNLVDNSALLEFELLYNTDRCQFVDKLLERSNSDTYYILQRTIGKHFEANCIVTVWWALLQIYKRTNDTPTAIKFADMYLDQFIHHDGLILSDIDTEIFEYMANIKIDLAGSLRIASLKQLNNTTVPNNKYFPFILQCGHRQHSSVNNIIKNINEPLIEINIHDAAELSIEHNELIILQTETAELQIKCTLVDTIPPKLLRIANHIMINQLTTTNSADYYNLNPQYKSIAAGIRKIT